MAFCVSAEVDRTMSDKDKTKEQLLAEVSRLRKRVAELEAEDAGQRRPVDDSGGPDQGLLSVINAVPDIIYRLDSRGRIAFVNDAIKAYGYTPEELTGTRILDLVHPEDREKATYRVNERRTGERSTQSLELRFRTKDGVGVPFEVKSSSVQDEPVFTISAEGLYRSEDPEDRSFIGTRGVARDITERRGIEEALQRAHDGLEKRVEERTAELRAANERLQRAEKTLRESEERLRTIVENTRDIIYSAGPDGTFTFVSPQVSFLGYTPEEVVGRKILEFVHPDDIEHVLEDYQRTIETGEEFPTIFRLMHRDGIPVYVEESGKAIWEGGEVVGVTGVVRNIAERKQMEEEMVRLERLHALGKMSAGVSHNLNNILTGVLGPAQLVQMSVDDPQLIRQLDIIIKSAERAAELVSRLHGAVRGSREDDVHAVPINELVMEAVRTARPKWKDEPESRGISLEVTTDLEAVPPILGTESGLHDILLNLLLNAVDAMPEGGTIEIGTEAVEEGVRLTVRDTGVGMDEETRMQVFEPFFTTKMDVGTGLGLSTVYGTVTRWGGSIEVESSPGRGATFSIYLSGASC